MTRTKFPDPLPAPFAIGQRVRYVGPNCSKHQADIGWVKLNTGDIGECVRLNEGWKGGAFLGYDEEDGEPNFSHTAHDWSTIEFPNRYRTTADAESDQFEPA